MDHKEQSQRHIVSKEQSHIDRDSVLFERIVPIALVVMGIVTVVVILLALGILLGVVNF
jgi:uncharacterized membrane protein